MNKFCPKCSKRFPETARVCPHDGTNLVQLDESDLVGSVLDNRYTILSRIGKGGMGVVYKAEQHLIERVVALKVLNKEIVKEETSVKRFLNEARAIASLENPHTVTLYDFGVTPEGLLYYTMELLVGRPLAALLKKEGPLSVERSAEIIFQTLQSLEEAHTKGILHRDIKPDNLFLQARPAGERVKVLDFGIAKLVGEGGEGTAITKTGMICGTPQYLSPEQVVGNPAVPASDLYSLGVVFYEMLAGMPPFFSPTPMKLLLQHLNEEPEPISVKNPRVSVPASINRFVERALAKAPEDRFGSVAEFRAGLQDALAHTADDTESLAALVETQAGARALRRTAPLEGAESLDPSTDRLVAAVENEETQPEPGLPEIDDEETLAVVSPGRQVPLVGIGLAVAAIAILAVLLVWQPWRSGTTAEQAIPSVKSSVADVTTPPAQPGEHEKVPARKAPVQVAAQPEIVADVVTDAPTPIDAVVSELDVVSQAPEVVDVATARVDVATDLVLDGPDAAPDSVGEVVADVTVDVASDVVADAVAGPEVVASGTTSGKSGPESAEPVDRSSMSGSKTSESATGTSSKSSRNHKKSSSKSTQSSSGSDSRFHRIEKPPVEKTPEEKPPEEKKPEEKKPEEKKKPFGFRRIPTN